MEKSVWVLVGTGGRTFIGEWKPSEAPRTPALEETAMCLSPCYAVNEQYMQTPEGLAHNVAVLPVVHSLGDDAKQWVVPNWVRFLDQEDPSDRAAYMRGVEDAKKLTVQMRASRAGIAVAGAGPTPRVQ